VVATLGLLIRFTVQDRYVGSAVIYYALPMLVVGGLLITAGVLWMVSRKRMKALVMGSIGLVCVMGWFWAAYFSNQPQINDNDSVGVLIWNTGRIRGDVTKAVDSLLEHNAEIIGLVESGDLSQADKVTSLIPSGYQAADLGGGLVVIARGEISNINFVEVGRRNRIGRCTVNLSGEIVDVMLVDVDSNPLVSRKNVMEKIVELSRETNPDIIMGDFNAPSDSVWFNQLRGKYNESFEAGGTGLHATWPGFFPLLAIDHIWVNRSLKIGSSRIIKNPNSDHRMVSADVAGIVTP